MKTILGLDLGTTSIGWALVKEGENADIIKTGVRVIPLSTDEITNFDKGKSITTNADRTIKRAARRNLQRYKLRRENLIEELIDNNIISKDSVLTENGINTTHETYHLRSKAASEKISLEDFARILLMINKKRGYKSSRKAKNQEEGQLIDGMAVAKKMFEENLTPGQFVNELLQSGKNNIPTFYRSDLKSEFDTIWKFQSSFYPDVLTNENYEKLIGKSKSQTASYFSKTLGIESIELKGKMQEKRSQRYELRAKAVNIKLALAELIEIFPDINGDLYNSSGYLGAISDRSKELYFNKQTIGQYLYQQLKKNSHTRLKGQVFYRQDYLDEFETIWEKQAQFYKELTPALKKKVGEIIIFYQRRLKSQKHLISNCEFEKRSKTIPKSSPLFQEFRIWLQLNNVEVLDLQGKKIRSLELEEMNTLFAELNFKEKISSSEALKLLFKDKDIKLNFESLEGNRTNAAFIDAYERIIELSGHDNVEFNKMKSIEKIQTIHDIFDVIGISTSILNFDSTLSPKELTLQPFYQLWHFVYSFEGDNSETGIQKLNEALTNKYGFPTDLAIHISNVNLESDYGNLSFKAIHKLLPHLKEGNKYDIACVLENYNHSSSETTEQLDNKVLKDFLEILPKNSLRNPVVEKIINQMIHVVNGVITEYGKPDEIRVELARELKKSAKDREELTKVIRKSTDEHEKYKKILQSEFGLPSVGRNDLIRYKLYLELKENGFKTLYSNTYIPREKLFTSEFDIEHIVPKAKLFDDSFSNKTLELRSVNAKKSNATALDFVMTEYGDNKIEEYKARVNALHYSGDSRISKTKYKKLLMAEKDIPDNFINRDLGNTQYIAKKATQLLKEIVRTVGTTTGSITSRLREDWQLVDIMKELNFEKYKALGLIEQKTNRHGQTTSIIKNWTKRNDHRHHAMDAITVAFTKPSYIQYLNNLNGKNDKKGAIYGIEQKETYFDKDQKRRFYPPMPLDIFRARAKEHLENTLISFKAKNKVTTKNKNKTLTKNGEITTIVETPRGQLHKETVYGSINRYEVKYEKVNASFDLEKINKVANPKYKALLIKRLEEFGNDPKKAFTGANSLTKNPIFTNESHTYQIPETVKLSWLEKYYTIRKAVSPELKLDKVIDLGVRRILEERLAKFGGDPKKAFVNLEEAPIYSNKEKGLTIKNVAIYGVSNALPIHDKKDHFGNLILDKNGLPIPVDFVSTGNNHHVAIYRDEKGNLQEEVVSLMEAVTRKNQNEPIIKTKHELGWEFLFTMKQNEYFIFPNKETGFEPSEIDLKNPENYSIISPNLYRVQKLGESDYWFRHHLETTVEVEKGLNNVAYKRISSTKNIESIIKIRLNHIGVICHIGE
jgi:CRISPR-associated endonuclease Csn1